MGVHLILAGAEGGWCSWSRGDEGSKVYAAGMDGGSVEERSRVDGEGRFLRRRVLDLSAQSRISCVIFWTMTESCTAPTHPSKKTLRSSHSLHEDQGGEKSMTHISTRNPNLETGSR